MPAVICPDCQCAGHITQDRIGAAVHCPRCRHSFIAVAHEGATRDSATRDTAKGNGPPVPVAAFAAPPVAIPPVAAPAASPAAPDRTHILPTITWGVCLLWTLGVLVTLLFTDAANEAAGTRKLTWIVGGYIVAKCVASMIGDRTRMRRVHD